MNIEQAVLDFSSFLTHKIKQEVTKSTSHEKAEEWLNFLESQPKDTPELPDEALRREAIY